MKNWRKKEVSDSKVFGSKLTPRSGGFWFAKGDSRNETYLIEDKTSEHERFSVTTKLWEKINREALLSQRVPVMSLSFGEKKLELVVMSKDDFLTYVKEVKLPKDCEWCDDCEGKGYHEIWTK